MYSTVTGSGCVLQFIHYQTISFLVRCVDESVNIDESVNKRKIVSELLVKGQVRPWIFVRTNLVLEL